MTTMCLLSRMPLLLLYVIPLFTSTIFAHMMLYIPPPMKSKYDPYVNPADIDYSYTSPLNSDGSNFPCKGYQTNQEPAVENYIAGQSYHVNITDTASHNGGSCQLSISYDNGQSFQVIHSMIGGCPLQPIYNFTIPAYAPSKTNAIFAWTWINLTGNREFYMNCAWINISGGTDASYQKWQQLPDIFVAQLSGINSCRIPEGTNPVYPQPGPEVEYDGGLNSTSPPWSQNCEVPVNNIFLGPASVSTDPPASTSSYSLMDMDMAMFTVPSTTASNGSVSYTTVYVDEPCPSSLLPITVTMTASTITITPSPTCPPPTCTSCPSNCYCSTINACSATCVMTTTVTMTAATSTLTIRTSPTETGGSTPTSTIPTLPYATGATSAYEPCVPGTFLCASNTSFLTCNQPSTDSITTGWSWQDLRQVAAGMECLPFLSPISSAGGTDQYGQQPGSPQGYYRDDRYVRARPNGNCNTDGALQCNGVMGFWICDQGGWVDMGSLAAGTRCEDGEIVMAS
jgi:hypothetical protein